jgi:putative ABC transport system permease protein
MVLHGFRTGDISSHTGSAMDSLLNDLRIGIRSLLKSPLITLPAVVSLALGIAATVTIFSVADIVLFQPLRFPQPERLLAVWTTNPERGWPATRLSGPNLLDLRERSRTVNVAGYRTRGFNLSGTDEPERLSAVVATSNIFAVSGFEPVVGRGFSRDEESAGAHHVVLLGYDLWQARFAADPDVAGQIVKLDEVPHTILGVMPPDIPHPLYGADLWLPPGFTPDEHRGLNTWQALGRLSGGATLEGARAEMNEIAVSLEEAYPVVNAGNRVLLRPLREDVYDSGPRIGSVILLTAAFMVLIIACANVANLLLARALQRQTELAVRAALGARRWRIVRQLLTESVLLGVAGGALGLLVSIWGIEALKTIIPADPPLPEIGLDLRVLGFAVSTALLAGVIVGTLPALRISRSDLHSTLTSGGRTATGGSRKRRAQEALVGSQIALALVLLVCASMLIHTVLRMQIADLGFDPANLLVFRIRPPEAAYPDEESLRAFYEELVTEMSVLPGVASAATASAAPLSGWNLREAYVPEGESYDDGHWPSVSVTWASPGYFDTLGLAVLRGRTFTANDREGSTPVIVISEGLASEHWPGQNPVGKRIQAIGRTWEIVGVVEDVRHYGGDSPTLPMIYFTTSQSLQRAMAVILRTVANPAELVATVRAAVLEIDPDQPIYQVHTMEELIQMDLEGARIVTDVSAVLGMVALVMAALGIYGVMAYSVTQRTHETGIRVALGARPRDILYLMGMKGARVSLWGVAGGVVLSLAMMRVFDSIFEGFIGFDGLALGGATSVLLVASLVASFLPTRRAARLDAMVALRSE